MKMNKTYTLSVSKIDNDKSIQDYLKDSEKSTRTLNLTQRNSIKKNNSLRKRKKMENILESLIQKLAVVMLFVVMAGVISEFMTIEVEQAKAELLTENSVSKEILHTEKQPKVENSLQIIEDVNEIKEVVYDPDQEVIDRAVDFLRVHEGVRYTAYWDFKQYSICYGMKSTQWATATQEECDRTLLERVQSELVRINRMGDNLSVGKKVALISFFYNTGYNYKVLNYASRGDDASVIYLMNKYVMAGGKYNKGLAKRRWFEIDVYKWM